MHGAATTCIYVRNTNGKITGLYNKFRGKKNKRNVKCKENPSF